MHKSSGTFMELQTLSPVGMGRGGDIGLTIANSLDEIENGAEFEGSAFHEIQIEVLAALVGRDYRPNGDHLAGRNVETELLDSLEKLTALRDDDGQEPALRAAMVPEISKVEGQLSRREFMKPLRDENWAADIGEMVTRMAPHQIYSIDDSGLAVVETVTLKIETLRCSVDDYGEVCAWIYSEGEL